MKTNCYFAIGVDLIERSIAQLPFNAFLLYMPILLDLASRINNSENSEDFKRGGYLTLMDAITGQIIFTVPFGVIPKGKEEKYFSFSQEKAARLFSRVNILSPNRHTTSFESRNEEMDQWGGAIYLNGHQNSIILSFSGMPELIDEAMMLVLADKLAKDIHLKNITKIEACERNPYWETLKDHFLNHSIIMFSK